MDRFDLGTSSPGPLRGRSRGPHDPHSAPAAHSLPLARFVRDTDVAIVGAGAAGLAAAIFTRRVNPRLRVLLLEGAHRPGAKILVSGGGRCNVTNAAVSEHDFWGGKRTIVRRVLRTFPVADTIAFFAGLGVTLHEEEDGKLFPDTNRARDVLQALLSEVERTGARLLAGTRVLDITPTSGGFQLETTGGSVHARAVVLATGGRSLPKSVGDGAAFDFARRLGHTIVPTTPALVPLLLRDAPGALHRRLSGVAHPVELAVWINGRVTVRLTGSMLWTHFGISGPVALNASRHWLRAELEGHAVRLTAGFYPEERLDAIDARWTALATERPRATLHTALSGTLPASVAGALLESLGIEGSTALARLTRDDRRRLTAALAEWPLDVAGSRGYNYAEATAGGIALDEVDPGTMASRRTPGLFIVGEALDVDGRIGGFNFQWAWSSARVAAAALARLETR